MKIFRKTAGRVLFALVPVVELLPADLRAQSALIEPLQPTPIEVVTKYLQATHGRDPATAYRNIFSRRQKWGKTPK